jgi:hypothetical protein
MGKNTKPMLTVLVEGDKLQQFRDYALSKEVSMGWVVNRLLDRVLSGELDVMSDTPSIGVAREGVEHIPTGLTREDVERMIQSSISSLNIPSIDASGIEDVARASIEVALEPVRISVSELESYTRSQFAAVRGEIKKATSDRLITTEAHPKVVATVPDPVSPTDDGFEYLSFYQLATQLGYVLPVELKDKPPQVRATALIAYAATLGQSYVWRGKNQKLYRVDATSESTLPLFTND